MRKKVYLLIGLIFFLLFPSQIVLADVETGLGDEYSGIYKNVPFHFDYNYGMDQEGLEIIFCSENPEAQCVVQYGHIWYDQEDLLFSEMVNTDAQAEILYRWLHPDCQYNVLDIEACSIGNTEVFSYCGNTMSMTHGYRGKMR